MDASELRPDATSGGLALDVPKEALLDALTCPISGKLFVDPVTAVKIREIHALKDEAVAREDYDEAKRLRDGINRLKAVGAKIGQLEARKRAAVEAEDYEAAKLIKVEIDKLRDAGGVTALGESVGAGSGRARRGEDDEAIFAHVQANRDIIDRPPVDLIQPGGAAPLRFQTTAPAVHTPVWGAASPSTRPTWNGRSCSGRSDCFDRRWKLFAEMSISGFGKELSR